ncbi:unnamed protein product [Heligmosomoides polygyrus]|uniref:Uncharacterized protein n=1 Tax=Heligmosomoides polygyrus TaxID=6339 RepID=A0A3P8I0M1_HELPZ|nr:unnamed protein product [Heligmosomoides polygyrus]
MEKIRQEEKERKWEMIEESARKNPHYSEVKSVFGDVNGITAGFEALTLKPSSSFSEEETENVEQVNQREVGFTQKRSELPPDMQTEKALEEYKRHDAYLRKLGNAE